MTPFDRLATFDTPDPVLCVCGALLLCVLALAAWWRARDEDGGVSDESRGGGREQDDR